MTLDSMSSLNTFQDLQIPTGLYLLQKQSGFQLYFHQQIGKQMHIYHTALINDNQIIEQHFSGVPCLFPFCSCKSDTFYGLSVPDTPVASYILCLALPVGAASKIILSIFNFSCIITIKRSRVVLPLPGPPVIMETGF